MLAKEIWAACRSGMVAWMNARRARPGGEPRRRPRGAVPSPADPLPVGLDPQADLDPVRAVASEAAKRLWRLGFAVPAVPVVDAPCPERATILAALAADELNPAYLPRRPTLMPQLMQAVNDPSAAAERISRIIVHDPVLSADVLRLANSSRYRSTVAPLETIQRAITVCGVEALRLMLATAMLRPVFRATRGNFPRFPRLLWERTERAARAAELYAQHTQSADRCEAQLLALLRALGPLVVYGAALDVYAQDPALKPNPGLCAELVGAMGPSMAVRVARDWDMPPRLLRALDSAAAEPLAGALYIGEFLGTLAFLESHAVMTREQTHEMLMQAGLSGEPVHTILAMVTSSGSAPGAATGVGAATG
jgi:HD-like signal output (HDOD) protein